MACSLDVQLYALDTDTIIAYCASSDDVDPCALGYRGDMGACLNTYKVLYWPGVGNSSCISLNSLHRDDYIYTEETAGDCDVPEYQDICGDCY
jgi:hypothetical protein